MQGFKLSLVISLVLGAEFSTFAQEISLNKYGLPVITDVKTYNVTVRRDSSKKMIELKSMVPGIVYDLKYATQDNFMKTRMYPVNTRNTFMRLPAARALAMVQSKLKAQGYGLKVWDAYRPYSVTERFWEMVKDERYVANPSKASGHNRGIAIDVTVIELATGKELDMGTGFDNFTDTAHHTYTNLSAQVLRNRKVLKDAMESSGFVAFESEWWHYSLPNAQHFEPLDVMFKKLKSQK